MVEAKVRMGAKGQIVVPKLLRDEFGMLPGHQLLLVEQEHGVLLQRPPVDAMALLDELSAQARAKKLKIPPVHAIEEQYEQRARRAGVLK